MARSQNRNAYDLTADAQKVTLVDATGTAAGADVTQAPIPGGAATATKAQMVAGEYRSTLPTLTTTQQGPLQLDTRGNLRVHLTASSVSAADGINNAGVSSMILDTEAAAVSPRPLLVAGYTFNGTTWDREKKPNAVARLPSAAGSTNATSAKGSAGDVFAIIGENAAITVRYLKLYNKATAPTVGTDTPVLTLALKASSPFSFSFPSLYFSTGIAYALTTGAGDADTGAVTAGDILGLNIVYQ